MSNGIKKAKKKLTEILSTASQKIINPEHQSFRLKYVYFIQTIP